MADYVRPQSIDEAVAALAARHLTVLAGGTDFFPARAAQPLADAVLDITGIDSLRGIAYIADHWRIGATTTWADIDAADLPPVFDGLRAAAREIGGPQIQNAGTLCGNLCNASPAADGVPPLSVMDAHVELTSVADVTQIPLSAFIQGKGQTVLRPDQLMTAVLVPTPRASVAVSDFRKLGARKNLVISIIAVATVIEADDGVVTAARVAVGACGPAVRRLQQLESQLLGLPLAPELGNIVEDSHFAALSPIDDIRATAAYRCDAARRMVADSLAKLGGQPAVGG